MPDLLIELFSEEIPARMQRRAADDLKKMVTDALVEMGLPYEGAKAFVTPRRLALTVHGVPARSPDRKEEKRGPRSARPEGAIAGFLKSAGLASIQGRRSARRQEGRRLRGGDQTGPAVRPRTPSPRSCRRFITGFPWPKSMRWGEASARPGSLSWGAASAQRAVYVRPGDRGDGGCALRYFGIASGRVTRGIGSWRRSRSRCGASTTTCRSSRRRRSPRQRSPQADHPRRRARPARWR